MADTLSVGTKVIIDPVLPPRDPHTNPGGDPYIFQMQNSGTISGYAPQGAGFMVTLHSAVGEWGPVPAERLKVDRSDWRTGDWH